MLSVISKTRAFKGLIILLVSAVLLSFSPGSGGEGFEIYVNNKVILQQFGSKINEVKTLKLDPASDNDEISVRYHHCGRAGKNRSITIKDDQDKVLKEWKFSDASDAADRMTCKMKDITGLKKGKASTLKLYYSSNELSKERQLASLSVGAKTIGKL